MSPELIDIQPEGAETCAAVPFRWRGRLNVAIIAKATFSMVPGGLMTRAPPEPIATEDQRAEGSQSLLITSDLVPLRPRVDVLLRGHARALAGVATKRVALRLAMARGGEVVLDKRLLMRGPPGMAGIEPFVSAPLVYDLAPSGKDGENPAGVAPGAWARLIDARRPDRPAGFGPIDPLWPSRKDLLPFDRALLNAPIPYLPEPAPWAYWSAAPADQRLDELRGDEWICLEGMSAELPRVEARLPNVLAFARLFGPMAAAGSVPIPLIADTLSIDADSLRCSIVFRGRLTVPNEDALRGLIVMVEARHSGEPTRSAAVKHDIPAPSRREPSDVEAPQEAEAARRTLDPPLLSELPPVLPFVAPEASNSNAAEPCAPPPTRREARSAHESAIRTLDAPLPKALAPVLPFVQAQASLGQRFLEALERARAQRLQGQAAQRITSFL